VCVISNGSLSEPSKAASLRARFDPAHQRWAGSNSSLIMLSYHVSTVAELFDIPVGPCQGFYVLDSISRRRRRRRRQPYKNKSKRRRGGTVVDEATGLDVCVDTSEEEEEEENKQNGTDNILPDDYAFRNPYFNQTFRKENRVLNLGEREESTAVQYMTLGGHVHYITGLDNRQPNMACSSIHSGAGQQVFGWGPHQRSDLTLVFYPEEGRDKLTRIYYHNYHGQRWHYSGHMHGCPLERQADTVTFEEHRTSVRMDNFRHGLAKVFTEVRPDRVVFDYSVSYACQLFHGMTVPSTKSSPESLSLTEFGSVTEALMTEQLHNSWLPYRSDMLDPHTVERQIMEGRLTGFVTVLGGREDPALAKEDPAGSQFGFCVQNYAPSPGQLSPHTKKQISSFYGADDNSEFVDKYIANQSPRTINSTTFHTEETVSTTYLRWLMEARGFRHFKLTHVLIYEFRNWSKDFLEPILQARHDYKKKGNTVAAECLKLIGNGSFGYNGLESCNYDQVRIMTDHSIRNRRKRDMAHLTFKHLTLIGVVRTKIKSTKRRQRPAAAAAFVDDEAVDDDDDDDEEEEERNRGDDDDDLLIVDSDRDDDNDVNEPAQDLEEELINEIEVKDASDSRQARYRIDFLYAVALSGRNKTIMNNLPKAVAVLSNSKKLFLSHLDVMFRCLDPKLAEIAYIDTDSCIWSLSYPCLEDCLRVDRVQQWKDANILADEDGPLSCHGKMKLEGTHKVGHFKTMKIYRLFNQQEAGYQLHTVYTRCKGVNRYVACRLPDSSFEAGSVDRTVIHRSALKPSRTGEMLITHEARSLAVPFNLKRFTCSDGIHTFPISHVHSC